MNQKPLRNSNFFFKIKIKDLLESHFLCINLSFDKMFFTCSLSKSKLDLIYQEVCC